MRCRVLSVLMGSVLACAALPAMAAGPVGSLRVAVGNTQTRASTGTSCTSATGPDGRLHSTCTEASYPLRTRGYVVLRPRHRLRMVFSGRPTSVLVVWRVRAEPESRAVFSAKAGRDSRNPHRFKLLLPRRLPCAAIIDILARNLGNNTDYWTAIRSPGCRRVSR